MFIIGFYIVLPATTVSGDQAASINIGANYYYRITFNILKAGRISGTFSETSGNSITLYIFNQQQQTGYQSGQTTDNMFSTSGSTGSFSASVLSPGNYYLVLEHGASFTDQVQNVQVSWVLDGSNLALLGTGLAILATGLVFLFIGYRKMHRASPPPSATDVVMFDQPGTTSLSK